MPVQKVLILSYYYPSCGLTASARAAAWARHLPEFGYYPIVVTRKWEHPIRSRQDLSRHTSNGEEIKANAKSTTIRLPYRGSLKDRIYARHGDAHLRLPRKALSFAELLLQNYFLRPIPFRNLYFKAHDLLATNPDLEKVVITANPFVMFSFGHRLKQEFPRIRWIADYRDDWNTTELTREHGVLQRMLRSLESRSERTWVASASLVTTVSEHYRRKLGAFLNREARLLANGFSGDDLQKVSPRERADEFVITYNGTLYPSQPIEVFLEGFRRAARHFGNRVALRMNFPGLAFDSMQAERVRAAMQGYEERLHITERISRDEVFALQNRSHAFLMVSHTDVKGTPSTKLYEYLCFRKPVFLCPDDGNIIRETLDDAGLGVTCNSPDEVARELSRLVERHLAGRGGAGVGNWERIMKYSRRSQTRALADMLDSL